MENPIKMDDLGVPVFSETSTFAKITAAQPRKKQVWSWISEFFLGAQWLEN